MYNISQFKPTLYAVLLLGMLGYALAAESAGVWVLGTAGVMLNAWLVLTGRFAPMPRILANVITIASVLYVVREVFVPNATPVMVIGKFLVLLQLIKLWEQRANRDYTQLLVLSLLLMVAASINTTSLLFGVVMLCYLFLSLYCCLLFHLKVESDGARLAFAVPAERLSPATLRQDERYLGRSMRRLTGFVSGVSIATAVVVFLMIPRGAGAGMFGPLHFRPAQTLTGFSENVSFQQLAKITQSTEEVARVTVLKNGAPLAGTEMLLLRGIALDSYSGKQQGTRGGQWQWNRSKDHLAYDVQVERNREVTLPAVTGAPPGVDGDGDGDDASGQGEGGDVYLQRFALRPTGTLPLFAIAGPTHLTPRRDVRLRYTPSDGVIQLDEPINRPIEYEVVSTGVLPPDRPPGEYQEKRRLDLKWWQRFPRVYEYTVNPEVSGADDAGRPLAAQRPREQYVHPLDERIARHVEEHLKRSFTYTLDLTDAAKLRRDDDPMVAFLYDLKRGHCEYFAGAMALMCQSLGMQARVVNGFKCDEYNQTGGYYIVRQSHAHSWVEVLTARGWRSFDPTTSQEDTRNTGGAWQRVKHFFDFLEFTYANAVIAYDNDNRANLMQSVEARMTNTSYAGSQRLQAVRDWFDRNMYSVSSKVIGAAMVLMITAMVGMVVYFLWERWMLRRKAARIGLESLPTSDQLRLVRQLGFYDDLVRLLARHHITRPKHLTPLEFSQTLLYLPGQAFDTIRRLTELFYRVRYGHSELSPAVQRRLDAVVAQLEACLGPAPKGKGATG